MRRTWHTGLTDEARTNRERHRTPGDRTQVRRRRRDPDSGPDRDPGSRPDCRTDQYDLDAVYFDTAELSLATYGITLRRRQIGRLLQRVAPEAAGRPGPPRDPGPAGSRRQDSAGGSAPRSSHLHAGSTTRPVATIRTRRLVTALIAEDGGTAAEFCDDHVGSERGRGTRATVVARVGGRSRRGHAGILDAAELRRSRRGCSTRRPRLETQSGAGASHARGTDASHGQCRRSCRRCRGRLHQDPTRGDRAVDPAFSRGS